MDYYDEGVDGPSFLTTYFSRAKIPNVAMLGVNHQIRNEALPMFYNINTFHFCDLDSMIPFLSDLTDVARQNIRSVSWLLGFHKDGCHDKLQKV